MQSKPLITIGIPVYHGREFIEDALQSIQQQTFSEFQAVISLDGSDAEVEKLCQPFLADSRFRLFIQPQHIGWVENLNWLMQRADTPFFCFQGQDDLLHPTYLETLFAEAKRRPNAAVIYSDINSFGFKNGQIIQPSVTGNAVMRQFRLLHSHHSAVALRGLTRLEALQNTEILRPNEIEGFSTDTVWMAAMARWGELRRVPSKLYKKRYHSNNEHGKWSTWSPEKFKQAWITHCADMLEQAISTAFTAGEARLLWTGALIRLISTQRFGYTLQVPQYHNPITLLEGFIEHIQQKERINVPAHLEQSWSKIFDDARSFYKFQIATILRYAFQIEYSLRTLYK